MDAIVLADFWQRLAMLWNQYCSRIYQALLQANGLLCRMSAKGNCYENGSGAIS